MKPPCFIEHHSHSTMNIYKQIKSCLIQEAIFGNIHIIKTVTLQFPRFRNTYALDYTFKKRQEFYRNLCL